MLKVKRLNLLAKLPVKAYATDLGYDLFAVSDLAIYSNAVGKVSTGIACEFPDGYGGLLRDRSSVATKSGLFVVAGVIDNSYRGEILVALFNSTGDIAIIKAGEKIAQMILIPTITVDVQEVTELDATDRGNKGFGSSGR